MCLAERLLLLVFSYHSVCDVVARVVVFFFLLSLYYFFFIISSTRVPFAFLFRRFVNVYFVNGLCRIFLNERGHKTITYTYMYKTRHWLLWVCLTPTFVLRFITTYISMRYIYIRFSELWQFIYPLKLLVPWLKLHEFNAFELFFKRISFVFLLLLRLFCTLSLSLSLSPITTGAFSPFQSTE